jgi:AraC family transcriptional regulator, arabinose operon regulatory protein
MGNYAGILDSLTIKFAEAQNYIVKRPHVLKDYRPIGDALVLLNTSNIQSSSVDDKLVEGDIVFVPSGRKLTLTFGNGNGDELPSINNEAFRINPDAYSEKVISDEPIKSPFGSFTLIEVETKAFRSINFYTSLDLPIFLIKDSTRIRNFIINLAREANHDLLGNARILKAFSEAISVEVFRYMVDNHMFTEKIATKLNYFKDPRLVEILNYVRNNISGDLSNEVLANVASISEDYVGQYFKAHTGINPQDYVEYQRMQKALELLKTTKKSIREVGSEIGFRDTAYFCRRFKMMFGISAGKMRKKDTLTGN